MKTVKVLGKILIGGFGVGLGATAALFIVVAGSSLTYAKVGRSLIDTLGDLNEKISNDKN